MRAIPFYAIRSTAIYLAALAGAVGLFLAFNHYGSTLSAPAPVGESKFSAGAHLASGHTLHHVLFALALVIIVARIVGYIFRWMNQPAVIGEVVAGILLGPSLLGRVAPEVSAYVLPSAVAPFLSIIAQIGVILYMFIVGLELDTNTLRGKSHSSVAISHASIVLPFVLGSGLALWLYPTHSTSDVPFMPFALFMGVSMSVTAFPVLARILTDRGMHKSRLGAMALACAAVDDVTAWILLAFVVGVVKSQAGDVFTTLLLTAAFIAGYILIIRPLALRFVLFREHKGKLTQGMVAVVCVAMLISALLSEAIGIHAVFGAFLLGAIIPHDSSLAKDLIERLESFVIVLFLPAFFAFTGLRTQIGLVDNVSDWGWCAVIVAVASIGKLGGTYAAARLTGIDPKQSASLGILMNTRGLMELIVLNIGLDLGVLSQTLFAMMVIMALVTTFATTPILHLIQRSGEAEAPNADAVSHGS